MNSPIKVFDDGVDTITLVLGDTTKKHALVVDVKNDQLFFDGERLKTTSTEFNYNKGAMFEKNKGKEKTRIMTCIACGKVLAIDCGYDGRVFIKLFDRQKYSQYRGAPEKLWSYWHDRRAKEKKWYDQDLHTPKRVWKAEYKKDMVIA